VSNFFGSIIGVSPANVLPGQPLILSIDVQASKPEGVGAWEAIVTVKGNGKTERVASPVVGELWATHNWAGALNVDLGTMPSNSVNVNVKLEAGSRMWSFLTSIERLQEFNYTIKADTSIVTPPEGSAPYATYTPPVPTDTVSPTINQADITGFKNYQDSGGSKYKTLEAWVAGGRPKGDTDWTPWLIAGSVAILAFLFTSEKKK
jgi:hypothetical protein